MDLFARHLVVSRSPGDRRAVRIQLSRMTAGFIAQPRHRLHIAPPHRLP